MSVIKCWGKNNRVNPSKLELCKDEYSLSTSGQTDQENKKAQRNHIRNERTTIKIF